MKGRSQASEEPGRYHLCYTDKYVYFYSHPGVYHIPNNINLGARVQYMSTH